MMTKDNNEIRIYGENACWAVFNKRPLDIIQFFLTKEKLSRYPQVAKYLAEHKKAYHIVAREEIDKMTKATHHEDICMLVKKKPTRSLIQYLLSNPATSVLIALENVGNPHNVGAIIRSAAHFGANGVILIGGASPDAGSTIRTSEGGSEYVEIFEEKNLQKLLEQLGKHKFQILNTSPRATQSLYDVKWENRVVLLLGEEATGLSKEAQSAGTSINIPGTNQVESLNVSVAAAVLLSDYYRKVKTK
jgi:TrmH RNA methyltransferase